MNDFSYLIEYLRIGRRQEDAAKREVRFEVIIVNQNYNIAVLESTQYLLKTDFDNPALITPLASILEGHDTLFYTNDAGTLTYYIRRQLSDEPQNSTYEYRNILSDGWITLTGQDVYSISIPFSKDLYFYSEVYRSVILKQLDEILPITDWFIYHPNDTASIDNGEYGFDYKDHQGNTKNDPLKLLFLQFISTAVSTYKRNVTVDKSPFSNKTYLFPIVTKMSNRYILKYHIKTDDPLETLRFQEIWSIRLEFTYLGSCLEFLNQTIMHDYEALDWETKPRKAFLDSYKTIVNNALMAANSGSIEEVLEILYYLPKAFIKEIDKNLLWDFLDRSLKDLVTNVGLDKEDLVLVLLEALSEVARTPTIFLSELIQPKSGGESRFLLLYKKMNGENFKQTIQLLYKFWLKSTFSDSDNPVFKNSDGPLFLPYKSDKFLGFYSSNKNFTFQKDNTILVTPDDHYIDEIIAIANPAVRNIIDKAIEDKIEYQYHPFQPVYLTETEQEAEIDLPKIVPAFFIKANEDKTFWANIITGIEYSLDILTILSGIGNITKFRYLYRLEQAAGAMATFRLATGAIEISSGAVSAMVKLSGTKNEFALALQKHLVYLELIALSGELSIAIRNRLKSSAEEVLKHTDDIEKELDDLIERTKNNAEKDKITQSDKARLFEHLNELVVIDNIKVKRKIVYEPVLMLDFGVNLAINGAKKIVFYIENLIKPNTQTIFFKGVEVITDSKSNIKKFLDQSIEIYKREGSKSVEDFFENISSELTRKRLHSRIKEEYICTLVRKKKGDSYIYELEEFQNAKPKWNSYGSNPSDNFDCSIKIATKEAAKNQNLMYADLFIPRSLNDFMQSYKGSGYKDISLGETMLNDGFAMLKRDLGKEVDGIYAEWLKSSSYIDYPNSESVNLSMLKNAMGNAPINEKTLKAAAFETFTGKWAKSKGYTKVEIVTKASEYERITDINSLKKLEIIFKK